MPDMVTPQELVDYLAGGNVSAAARRFGVTRQSIHTWLATGQVPPYQQDRFELFKLRDAVSRTEKPQEARSHADQG